MNTESTNIEIRIDERMFEVTGLREFAVEGPDGRKRRAFAFDFKVTHEEYHDVATLLYNGTFRLRIPQLEFDGETDMHNYSTSLDNLYEKDTVGDYHLELAERS